MWKRNRLFKVVFPLLFLFMVSSTQAQLCPAWGTGESAGVLDVDMLPEASGIAVSRAFENTLYHINDSSYGSSFYLTDLRGGNTRQVQIEDFVKSRHDPEDVSVGPCDGNTTCLFVGDIGDNRTIRDRVRIYVIKEQAFGDSVHSYRRVLVRYPDGPRDAESLAVHPNGDIYILSKEADISSFRFAPARLYRLGRSAWEDDADPEKVHELSFVGELDLLTLSQGRSLLLGWIPTSMDIAPDGQRLLVLTYDNAFEFNLDLSEGFKPAQEMVEGEDFSFIPLRRLLQQEAVAYGPQAGGFFYTTEIRAPATEAELMWIGCRE
jgi:hypothetical protein